jgi:hypothetical protein
MKSRSGTVLGPHARRHIQPPPTGPPQQRQPLTGRFRGTEDLGTYSGYSPKSVGAICDPAVFTGVVEVGPGILGPQPGVITVDLVEVGHEPLGGIR